MSHSTTNAEAVSTKSHFLFSNESNNWFGIHGIGAGYVLITTLLIYAIAQYAIEIPLKYFAIIFVIAEYFVYQAIEETREEVPPLSEDPMTINGKFNGMYAQQGSFVKIWPVDLRHEERIDLQPKSKLGKELVALSGDKIKIIGGTVTYSYRVNPERDIHFTKNTEENFTKTFEATLTTEVNTIVSNNAYAGDEITKGLEQKGKELLVSSLEILSKKIMTLESKQKSNILTPGEENDLNNFKIKLTENREENDILILAKKSGVIIESIKIAPFNPEDEEDKDAQAQKSRQKATNDAEIAKAVLVGAQMKALKESMEAAGMKPTDADIKDLWEQKFGGKTKIDTGGAPIWGVGTSGISGK